MFSEEQQDDFILFFGEPGGSIRPISFTLLASLIVDLVALLFLGATLIAKLVSGNHKVDKVTCKSCARGRKAYVFTLIDILLLGIGLILFGAVLIVAFSSPIFFVPSVSYQRVEVHSAPINLAICSRA